MAKKKWNARNNHSRNSIGKWLLLISTNKRRDLVEEKGREVGFLLAIFFTHCLKIFFVKAQNQTYLL